MASRTRSRQQSWPRWSWSAVMTLVLLGNIIGLPGVDAYRVAISNTDQLRQTCSGMWSVTFLKGSTGTIASIFYEWTDFPLLGKPGPEHDIYGEAFKTYVCTPEAVKQGLCDTGDLAQFIVQGKGKSIQRQRVDLGTAPLAEDKVFNYPVNATGYYCVGATAVPLTADDARASFEGTVFFHNIFKGELPGGEYPKLSFYFGLSCLYILLGLGWGYLCVKHKSELLMVQHFVSGLFVILIVEQLITWAYYAYLNNHSIDFWRLASTDGKASETWAARALLVIESVIDSTRNSASFFLLLLVAMGYGLVRPTIDPRVMLRVKVLTAVHLICGCLYSVGIVLLSIEAGGTWVFLFIFPLAFTLTALMMWSLNSLNATIQHLTARKQLFKLSYFLRLYRILLAAVVVIALFFVASSFAFSQSGGENFPSQTWKWRWFLLDGWTASLYLAVFAGVAWIWRPTGSNLRLSMSDEIATSGDDVGDEGDDIEMGGQFAGPAGPGEDSDDEDDNGQHGSAAAARKRREAEEEAAARRGVASSSSSAAAAAAPPAYEPPPSRQAVHGSEVEDVVFSLGDDDDADDSSASHQHQHRHAQQGSSSSREEGQGLLLGGDDDDDELDRNASQETLTASAHNNTMTSGAGKSATKRD